MVNLDPLIIGKDLNRRQSKQLFTDLLKDRFPAGTPKQFLALIQKKGIHSNELTGFIDAVRSMEKPIRFQSRFLADGCGTGGDGKHTFNISTLACLVAAAAGAQIAKHGNKSVSSLCGSSDLMISLGVKIDAPQNRMLKALRQTGFGYFHAPLYHPIFKRMQPIRSELARKKIKTLFNLAGPFLNPVRPNRQLIGVWRKDLVPVLAETARNLKMKHTMIIWNVGGFDELTTGSKTFVAELAGKRLKTYLLNPSQFDLKRNTAGDLKGGRVSQNRKISLHLLSGKDRTPRLDVVLLNAGTILYLAGKTKSIHDGIRLAKQAVYSQSALKLVKKLARISHGS